MRNRMLSLILSISIILGNFSTGFAVIAEGEIGTTDSSNPTTENTEQEEQTKPSEDVVTQPTDEAPNIEPSEEQNGETVDVKVVLNKESIFYGQDLPFDDEGNMADDFYYFVDSNTDKKVESTVLNSAVSLKAVLTDGQVASNSYANFQFEVISDELNIVDGETIYNLVTKSLYFAVNGYYSPDNVEVISYIENGVLYIKSNNNQYAVGKNSAASSFSESSQEAIAVSELEGSNGVYTYYLRNIDDSEGNTNYHAISSPRQISIEDEMELSQEALVSDIIFSQIDSIANYNAYNHSITITVTGKAKSDSASIAILNNGVTLYSDNAEKIGTENGKNIFQTTYTFELNDENPTIRISNLTAKLSVNGKSISNSLLLTDNNRNTKNDLLLENIKPDVEVLDTGKNYTHIKVTDNQSKLSEVYYRIENGEWTKPTTGWIQQLNQQNPDFQSGAFSDYQFYIYTGKKGHNGTDSVEIKIIDCAGNERIYPNSTEEELMIPQDGSYPEIDSVTILDGKLNTYAYGNYINQDIRLKVTAHDAGHKTDNDHGIKDIWISDSETRLSNKANIEYIKTKDPDTGDLIKTSEVDYYYFELPIGTDIGNLIINIRDDGRNVTSESLGTCINVDSSYLRIEDTDPIVDIQRPTYSNSPDMNSSLSNNWYGIERMDDTISISFGDWTSGIAQIVILDNGVAIDNLLAYQSESNGFPPNTVTKNSLKYLDYTSLPQSVTDLEFVIPIKIFSDGEHVLSVIGIDNAGNEIVSKNGDFHINNSKVESGVLEFSTDFNHPWGTVNFVTEPKEIKIDSENQYWFNGCGAESEKVVFTLEISDKNPYKVEYSFVNSESQNVYNSELLYITSDGTKIYSVEIDDADAKIELEQKHYLDVYVTFVDQAGNTSTYDDEDGHHEIAPIRFHKDFSYPKINKVTVSKTETGLDKVLRVLTFGIYSNNNIKYTVNTSDIPNDSGLADDSVLIAFGDSKYVMTRENDTTYSYVIDAGDEMVLSGEIMVSVTDKYGLETNRTVHYSEDFDVINGTAEEPFFTIGMDQTNYKDFMIDKNRPTVEFEPLISDGQERTDNTIWFKDDHDIKFTVNDADSGISSIIVIVNGDESNPLVKDSDGLDFLTEQETSNYPTIDYVKKTISYRLSTDNLMTSIHAEDGHYVIEVIVTDYAGNVNESSTIDYYIDKINPRVESIDFSIPSADNYTDAADFIDILEYGYYFRTDLIATVNITDDEPSSGLYNIEYNLIEYNNGVKGAENLGTARIENGKASFTIPANFKGQIFVKGYDYVGNASSEVTPQSFVVDTPERHESEQHIEITGMGDTNYTDAEGHPLFSSNVNITVRVIDTMSGIREISYSLDSENDVQENKTIVLSNTGYSVNQELGDGWIITAMDENLVTEVVRNYTFSADNNNVQLSIGMKDRSNNESSKQSDIFSVDQTAPVINVVFDAPAGNGDCYRAERTATITVIERNFDSSRITPSIQNTFGGTPIISGFSDVSKTEHTATITFGEGDYTFSIAGTDRCDHTATINYSGGNEQNFRVDMTDPVLVHNFDQFVNDAKNSFNIDKEMTLTITEHNFIPSMVAIHIYRTAAGQELSTSNREECTSEYISANKWESTGDTHTISFTFSSDYVYQVVIGGTDESGRAISDTTSPVFEIDKTKPVLKTPKNLDVLVYTIKNTETEATPIIFEDSNIAKVEYSVVSYQMKINEENVGYDMSVNSKTFESKNGTVKIGNEFFNQDGIYEVKCVPYDIAGNAGDESTHTYVIQRETDFLVYIPNSNKENHTGLYKFDQTGIRSADFEDIEIISYITKDKTFSVEVDGVEVTDSDLETKHDDRKINQVDMYDVTVKNSYISQNFSEDTVDTDLTLNAVAKGNDTSQKITLGHIYIDNVKPMGEYEKSLQDIGFFDGYYGVESKTVMIEGVSPDIDVNRCEIQANNETLTFENGGFQYDENAHTISFTLNKGYTDIRPTLVDNAGNINNLEIIKNVYVGNLFVRWWYLFILGGLIVLAIPTIFIIMIVRKKKVNNLF